MIGTRFSLGAAFALSSAAGCRCDTDEHHPYTPFGVAGSSGSASAPMASAHPTSEPAPPVFEVRRATAVSPPAAKISVGSEALLAPDGWLFERYLVLPQPGEPIAAWLVPASASHDQEAGGLWMLGAGQAPAKLAGFPAYVPVGPECEISPQLSHTGPQTLTLDVAATCPVGGIPRAPTRSLTVLRMSQPAKPLLQLRLAAAPESEQLGVAVDSKDRDADGHDDVAITFTIEKAGSKRESSATVVWLDRAAGPARDPSEPEKSFADIGSIEIVRAKGANTSAAVPARIDNARRLFAYLCSEGGTPRVTDADGVPLSCGPLETALRWYAQAEVSALLKQGDWGGALNAFDRANWYGAPHAAGTLAKLADLVRSAIASRPVSRVPVAVKPRSSGSEARRSPLAFDSTGALLVQTVDGVRRVRGGEVSDVSDEIDAWPLIAFSGQGRHVSGLAFPCDHGAVNIGARAPDGSVSEALRTGVLPPRPGPCGGNAEFLEPELRVVGWAGDRLHAFIGAEEYGATGRAPPMGTPLSPDGKSMVASTSMGLLVSTQGTAELWSATGALLRECVVSNGALTVACIEGTQAVLIQAQPDP